ncbi:aldo/keto reductase [Clostridium chromiireducens]|uniref:aldo/keto reductase n=1 Tax=Clostridium chromiireducens TaxID=225345 RepID=UPI003AF76BCA
MSNIEYRKLGAAGIKVPAMGIGTVAWGEKLVGYGKRFTRDDLFKAYKTSLDAGLNFFDTSESYGGGVSEQLLGEFHRQDGRPIVVATKFSPAKIYDPSTRFSPKDIVSTLDGSLKRLVMEKVDLYQLHYPVARHKLNKYLDAMAETVKSGKAKAVGVCNFNTELMKYAHEYFAKQNIQLASNQVGYNLLHRIPETNGMLTACKELGVKLIAILPLAEGVLTGKYRVGGDSHPSNLRNIAKVTQLDIFKDGDPSPLMQRLFTKPYMLQREKLEPLFELINEIAKAHDATISQVALNWLIAGNPLVIPIPGEKNAKQAAANAATLSWKLTKEEFERISQMERSIWRSLQN